MRECATRSLTILVVVLCAFATVCAQTVGTDVWELPRSGSDGFSSPNAEMARQSFNCPVSYATGTTNLQIPLLALPGGTVDVELGLNYRTDGIRTTDYSGGIGLGWTLTGLGSVSRQINGFPDEWRGMTGHQDVNFNVYTHGDDLDYFISILEGRIDSEYDLYFYNFPGYSGYFILQNGSIKQLPQKSVSIKRLPNNSNSMATDAFVITTPEGVEYTFDIKEHVEYRFDPNRILYNHINRGYDAVSSWNVSKIVGPERVDSALITYETCADWQRDHKQSLYNMYNKFSAVQGSVQEPIRNDVSGEHYTRFTDPQLPKSITTRSGHIDFEITRNVFDNKNFPKDVITGIKLYNSNNQLVTSVLFDNQDKCYTRHKLDKVTLLKDDEVVDEFIFQYINFSNIEACDFFGFSKLSTHGTNQSVLDSDLKLSKNRTPDVGIFNSLLSSITDAKGLKTTFVYEPAVITLPSDRRSILSGDITIGPRISAIITGDSIKVRRLEYSNAVCNFDLSRLTIDMFLSQSGLASTRTFLGNTVYSNYELNTTFTSASRTRGADVENARIYYGSVTEYITGKDIAKPIKTVYEYDLTRCDNRYYPKVHSRGMGDKALGIQSEITTTPLDSISLYVARSHPTYGYYQQNLEGKPLLKALTTYETRGNQYEKRHESLYHYSVADSVIIADGVFCESMVYRTKNSNGFGSESKLNVETLDDVNFFNTDIRANRIVCDSVFFTSYYPDKSSRRITKRYIYEGVPKTKPWQRSIIKLDTIPKIDGGEIVTGYYFPGFRSDSIMVTASKSYYPLATIVECGDESETVYDVRSEYTGSIFRDTKGNVNYKRLPVIEKLVFAKNSVKDSVLLQYEYGRYNCNGKSLIRPTRIYQYGNGNGCTMDNIISKQSFSKYDHLGRVISLTDDKGLETTVTWMPHDDLPLQILYNSNTNSRLTFTHEPLIGCTAMTMPNGKSRQFSYNAGRLSKERNTKGQLLADYSYQLVRGDSLGANYVVKKQYDTFGNVIDTIRYDSRGLPYLTVSLSDGKIIASEVAYDGLGRVITKLLPLPGDNRGLEQAKTYYNDTAPFTRLQYSNTTDNRPVSIANAGGTMAQHPTQLEYLCNSETNSMLKCPQYVLSGAGNSESITLKGIYKGGTLDVTKLTDGDGREVLTFTNWKGLKVLERRVADDDSYADTHYLYDVKGNLRVILQPEGVAKMNTSNKTWINSDDELQQYAFINRYDARGNCVYTKTPGAGATEMRYDRLNRLACRATAVMMENNEAEFMLYDKLGRPAVCLISHDGLPSGTLPLMTTTFNKDDAGIDGTGYSLPSGLDLSNITVTLVNYYDNYDCRELTGFKTLPAGNLNLAGTAHRGLLTGTRKAVYSGTASDGCTITDQSGSLYSLFGYDEDGNLTYRIETTTLPNTTLETNVTYSRQGRTLNTTYRLAMPDSTYLLNESNTYLASGQLKNCSVKLNRSSSDTSQADSINSLDFNVNYLYDDLGRLAQWYSNDYNRTQYEYNLRGQAKRVSTPLFTQTLGYEDSGNPCYNGNISQMTLLNKADNTTTHRRYTYDQLNRLVSLTSSDGFDTNYSYDLNSNLRSLLRKGPTSDNSIGDIDLLNYHYKGNQQTKVADNASPVILENSLDFADEEALYTYDSNGRLIQDTGRRISSICYDSNNRPTKMSTVGADICYGYSSTGEKLTESWSLKKTILRQIQISTNSTSHYIGPFVIIAHNNVSTPTNDLSRVNLPWGYIDGKGVCHSNLNDYQGNVRGVVDNSGNTVQSTDYYPYGLPISTSTGASTNRHKYNGVELDTRNGVNIYNYPFRQLFPDIATWLTPDPLAIITPHRSPYSAIASNPINFTDPLGLYSSSIDASFDAACIFNGAKVLFARDKGEYFIALDESGRSRYVSGGTLFREFGPKDGSYFFNPRSNSNYLCGAPYQQKLSKNGSLTASAIGISASAKTKMIDLAIPQKQQTGVLLKYNQSFKVLNKLCDIYNVIYTVEQWYIYETHGGSSWWVRCKYIYDLINIAAPYAFATTPAGPYVLIGSVTYTIADIATDGFSDWIDYSTPY